MKRIFLYFPLLFCMVITSNAAIDVNFGNSVKSGSNYTFPDLKVTGSPGDKGYEIRIMFTRPVTSGDRIILPTLPGGWIRNSVSTNQVQVIDISAGADVASIQSFLRTIQISVDVAKLGQSITVLISENLYDINRKVYYSSDTEHWYEYILNDGITWTNAYNAALDKTFMGMTGYLVVVTSVQENRFITTLINGDAWTSGTRMDIRSVADPVTGKLTAVPTNLLNYWYWSAGPEWEDNGKNPANCIYYDRITYDSPIYPVTIKYSYTNWDSTEPNNYNNTGEYYTHLLSNGRWNDYTNYVPEIKGYIIEYNGSVSGSIGIVGFNSKKDASIGGVQNNGTSGAPVNLVYGDELTYTITAVNSSEKSTTVIVRDTVPVGLEVVAGSISSGGAYNHITREIRWNINVPTEASGIVSYQVKKSEGVENLLIVNTAYVTSNGTIIKRTNSTYHRGEYVTFDFISGNNGTIINAGTQIIEYNQNPLSGIIITPDPGYQFDGWSYPAYTSLKGNLVSAASGIMDYTTINILGDITLTANFSIIDYSITYDLDGAIPGIPANPTNYTVESPDFTLSNPTKTGYKFVGWTGSNGPTPQETVTVSLGATDDKIYATNWQAIEYAIIYDGKGGNTPTGNPTKYTISDPATSLVPPVRPGYTFAGWKITSDSVGVTVPTGNTIPTGTYGNLTFEAQWSIDTYGITYTLEGGTASGNPTSYQVTDLTIALNDPVKSGYRFAGWTGSNGTTPQDNYAIPLGTTGNLQYTANWTMDNYIISYDYKGGTAPAAPNVASYNVANTPLTIANQPTRTGYTFTGWTGSNGSTSELTVTIGTGSTGDKSYEANWAPVNYTITYNGNGGSTPGNPGSYNITSPTITLAPSVRPGYTFDGWLITSDSPDVSVPTGTTIPTGTYGNLTFDAQWSVITYGISYDYNGGTAGPATNPIFYDITTSDITPNPPVRTGYTFTGWTITSDASGVTIPDGSSIPAGTMGNLICVANWSAITYNIAYDYNGGIDPGNPATYTIETPAFTLTDPTKPGKTFVGWIGGNGDINEIGLTIPQGTNGELIYTANWNYNFIDRYGADTLYNCSPSITLESGDDGLSYLWLLPDGSSQTTPSIEAPYSGFYYLQTNYGSMVLTDSVYVLYAFEHNLSLEQVPNDKINVREEEIFFINLNPLLTNVSYQWTVDGGWLVTTFSSDTATVIFDKYGDKKVTVDVTVTINGQTCQKTFHLDFALIDDIHGRGFFVDQNVVGGLQDGSSWENAYRTIQEALIQVNEGDFIWVARGEYTPENNSSYLLAIDNVEIYGGFGAWESYLYEREFYQNPTVLRGNGNSVIFNSNTNHTARWDGFIIEGGSSDKGGGVFNNRSSATIANSIIRGNIAVEEGGGIYSSFSSPTLYNVEISGNQAARGAGMYNSSSGANLINVTVSGNRGTLSGGGIYNDNSNIQLNNTIVWGNRLDGNVNTLTSLRATENSNLCSDNSTSSSSYCLIEGCGGSNNWNELYGYDAGKNIDVSPFFKKNGFDNNGSMQTGNYQLGVSSQAVNNGLNTHIYNIQTRWGINLESLSENTMVTGIPFDLAGMERIQDDRVDMGAYETGSRTTGGGIMHEVFVPKVEGLKTDPVTGKYYVIGHQDFVFTIWSTNGQSLDNLTVKTGIELRDKEGIRMVWNEDGSVTVRILRITEPIMITINGVSPVDNEKVEEQRVWSYGTNMHIATPEETVVRIYNMAGQLFMQQTVEAGVTSIQLPQGFYNVTLDGMKTHKIVIK